MKKYTKLLKILLILSLITIENTMFYSVNNIAFSIKEPKIVWSIEQKGKIISADDEYLIVYDYEALHCLNKRTGELKWDFPISIKELNKFFPEINDFWHGKLVISNGSIFFTNWEGTKWFLNSLDFANGKYNWRLNIEGKVLSDPLVLNGRVYVISSTWFMYCIAANDGSFIYKVKTVGYKFAGSIGNKIFTLGAILNCFDSISGDLLYSKDKPFDFGMFNPLIKGPSDEMYYFISSYGCCISNISCIKTDNGDEIWKSTLDGYMFSYFPAYVDDKLYLTIQIENEQDDLYLVIFDSKTGSELSRQYIKDLYTILIDDNKMYLLDKLLYCKDLVSNQVLWQYDIKLKSIYINNSMNNGSNICFSGIDIWFTDKTKITHLRITADTLRFSLNSNKYYLDQEEQVMDTIMSLLNYRTYLPAKYVLEPLGGSVAWDTKDKKVTCLLDDKTIELWVNKPTTTVNGKQYQIDPNNPKITPIIMNGRIMVPVRFLAEALGCEVKWIADTKTVILTYKP